MAIESLLYLFLTFYFGTAEIRDFRLPETVKPMEYDLTINPNLPKGIYDGRVTITVNVIKNVKAITLHSKNLHINYAEIDSIMTRFGVNFSNDFLILTPAKSISKGNYTIVIAFEGDMKNKTYGFFRGFEKENGKRTYFGTTFFEPVNARVAFPCFDEPTFKARFTIHIAKPPGYIALSNMNQVGESSAPNGNIYSHFAKTPLMSTYLVFFFIGNYTYIEDYYVKGNKEVIPTRVYSPHSKIHKARFAARQLPKQLKWFVDYTGFEYMLPKLDYITFNPNYHIEGGMENWGAISCREDSIFYTEAMSELRSNPLNIAHEFSHIWFGDLVTTSSWTQFWLNEGFARFMDVKANEIYKERTDLERSRLTNLHGALWRDDDLTAKPLSWEMKRPVDAYQLLNDINYNKGGSILQMVEGIIGKELMKKVIQTYVRRYQYQNVISQNFIDTLQNFVLFNATDFLNGFIEQPGYPLITVEHLETHKQIKLTMERFLRFGQKKNHVRWSAPITYITNLNRNASLMWFHGSKNQLILNVSSELTWIKLNLKQTGYYRTNYPQKMWRYFSKIMKDLDTTDRANLIDDSIALVRSGHLTCSLALDITKYLYDEDELVVWQVAQNKFSKLRLGLLQHNLTISHMKKYVTRLIDKQYNKYERKIKSDDTYSTRKARSIIFNLACFYGHEGCRRKVKELWNIRNTLPVDLKDIVLINTPNKIIDYNKTSVTSMEESSVWFGADLSLLPVESLFRWPRKIMENCNDWLKRNTE